MIDIDEDSEWSYVDKVEDEDQNSNPVIGEDALDRMAIALGGRAMLQCIMTTLPQMLQASERKEGLPHGMVSRSLPAFCCNSLSLPLAIAASHLL